MGSSGMTQILNKGNGLPMWVLSALAACLVYIGKQSLDKLDKVDRSVQDLRLEMTRDYVTRSEFKELMKRHDDQLDRLFSATGARP